MLGTLPAKRKNTVDKFTNYEGTKFNGIPKHGDPNIPNKSYILVPENTVHLFHNRPPFVPWGSLTIDIAIATYTLLFLYLIFSNLIYRLPSH